MGAVWYRIGHHTDYRIACDAVGCILYAAITNGQRSLCGQHATPYAVKNTVNLTAIHGKDYHQDQGHCVFCGGTDWRFDVPGYAYLCNACYPDSATIVAFTRKTIDITAFAALPDDDMLDALPRSQPIPVAHDTEAEMHPYFDLAAYMLERRDAPPAEQKTGHHKKS